MAVVRATRVTNACPATCRNVASAGGVANYTRCHEQSLPDARRYTIRAVASRVPHEVPMEVSKNIAATSNWMTHAMLET